jgi:plastocyanin
MLAVAATVAAGLVPAGQAAAGGTTEVAITDDHFSPADGENETFDFQWDPAGDGVTEHKHNVRQDFRFFNSGAPTKSAGDFGVFLEGAGSYHYYCEVHGSKTGGMDGVARMYMEGGTVDPGESQVVTWGSGGPFRYDVQYRVNGGKWKLWRKQTAASDGSFGAGDNPVNVNPLRDYEVRARTLKQANFDLRSGFSRPFQIDVT